MLVDIEGTDLCLADLDLQSGEEFAWLLEGELLVESHFVEETIGVKVHRL